MIKYIIVTIFLLILVIIPLFFLIPRKLESIPKFKYYDLNNNEITNLYYTIEKPLLVVYFSTQCGDCKNVIANIQSKKINDIYSVYYISSDSEKEVKDFLVKTNFSNKIKNQTLIDKNKTFQFDFSLGIYIIYPTLLYFDENGHFLKIDNEF